ncbi:MAG: hypothetical protein P8Z75_16390, partial [Gammaproteobacteria bacterium]
PCCSTWTCATVAGLPRGRYRHDAVYPMPRAIGLGWRFELAGLVGRQHNHEARQRSRRMLRVANAI